VVDVEAKPLPLKDAWRTWEAVGGGKRVVLGLGEETWVEARRQRALAVGCVHRLENHSKVENNHQKETFDGQVGVEGVDVALESQQEAKKPKERIKDRDLNQQTVQMD
jgi:hypothetical protein